MTWFETIAGNQRTASRASCRSSVTMLGAQTRHSSSSGSRPASTAAARACSMIHWMITGSASWMITPSATRPATPSARGPYAATYIGIRSRPWAQVSSSSFPFHSTGRPFIRSLIIRQEASNSAIFTGCWPITRRAESPRPIPMTARPPEMACSVA